VQEIIRVLLPTIVQLAKAKAKEFFIHEEQIEASSRSVDYATDSESK